MNLLNWELKQLVTARKLNNNLSNVYRLIFKLFKVDKISKIQRRKNTCLYKVKSKVKVKENLPILSLNKIRNQSQNPNMNRENQFKNLIEVDLKICVRRKCH